jgi:hypothetical protein
MTALIRLASEADAAAIAEIYRPYVEGSRISFEEFAPEANSDRRDRSPERLECRPAQKPRVHLIGHRTRSRLQLGEWIDVGRWQRDLAPRSSSPAEPRLFSELSLRA